MGRLLVSLRNITPFGIDVLKIHVKFVTKSVSSIQYMEIRIHESFCCIKNKIFFNFSYSQYFSTKILSSTTRWKICKDDFLFQYWISKQMFLDFVHYDLASIEHSQFRDFGDDIIQ
jgi:hypothetical protein